MKTLTFLLAALALGACTTVDKDRSARAWQMNECNRVIDQADRERCIDRVERNYGR